MFMQSHIKPFHRVKFTHSTLSFLLIVCLFSILLLTEQVLGPVVKSLLADEDQDFTLDPVELYRSWLGRQEVASGQRSALPYDVTCDVALSHEAVRTLVDQQTKKVLGVCARVQVHRHCLSLNSSLINLSLV